MIPTTLGLRTATVAVIGNPNAGKTTLFNRLTGLSQKVANYPGVTVEKKEGPAVLDGLEVRLLDLPGAYSLAAHSPEEMVAVDVLLGHQPGEDKPQLVLAVVDGSNLERNLYLLSQVLELDLPVVIALSMVDVASARGVRIDAAGLSRSLGVPVVPVDGRRGKGMDELERAMRSELVSARQRTAPGCLTRNGGALGAEVGKLHQEISPFFREARGRDLHAFEVLRAIVDRGGHAERRISGALGDAFNGRIESARAAAGGPVPLSAIEARERYAWIRDKVEGCVRRDRAGRVGWSERIDRVLTHRVLGLAVFAAAMLVVFQAIFAWAAPLMDVIDGAFAAAGESIASMLPEGAVQSLLVDGVIAGVGMVVVFLPQILILFFFIAVLEDCGYMARAAFLMDRIMRSCGLSGKSFIPMLSGFACAIPGIMATRVIEDRKDRLATILVTPLMSCSARLPVYALFIGAFIPERPVIPGLLGLQALTLFALYGLGIAAAVAVAWVLRRTLLRGRRAPFVLELPSYKWPAWRGIALSLFERGKAFLVRAGTIILAISIVVWGLAYFPRSAAIERDFAERREALEAGAKDPGSAADLETLGALEAGAHLRNSFFGRMGKAVEPAFEPLGWDWRISMAAIAAFPAREVLVSTLGTVFNLGEGADEGSSALRESLREARRESGGRAGEPLLGIAAALSVMVFFALCCQCGATVATIRRETGTWRWALFAFGYMTLLAYAAAFLTFRAASYLGGAA